MANQDHVAIFDEGVGAWNRWREDCPDVRPDLKHLHRMNADIRSYNLREADLSWSDLLSSDLSGAKLQRANLEGMDARDAKFVGADLTEAICSETTLLRTNFTRAILQDTDLSESSMVKANLLGATLIRTRVYGVSAWDVVVDEKPVNPHEFIVTPRGQSDVTVENLEVAQFVYLLLENAKLRDVMNTIGSKAVLVLGCFTGRKDVLEAIRTRLRQCGYLPIIFDFERPSNRDFTETVMTLAGLSRFIIADLTDPKSVPLELHAIVPNYSIPIAPIIEGEEEPFSMFRDLWQKNRDWVLDPLRYKSIQELLDMFEDSIVRRANTIHQKLQLRKAEEVKSVSY